MKDIKPEKIIPQELPKELKANLGRWKDVQPTSEQKKKGWDIKKAREDFFMEFANLKDKDGKPFGTIKQATKYLHNQFFGEESGLSHGDRVKGLISFMKEFTPQFQKEIDLTTKGESINEPDLSKLSTEEIKDYLNGISSKAIKKGTDS